MNTKNTKRLSFLPMISIVLSGYFSMCFAETPVIVLPDNPSAVEKTAAAELSSGLYQCLGENIEIVSESDAENGVKFYVGATKASKKARGNKTWQRDGVYLKSVPGGVVLDGDPVRAPIYAVDLYLEKYCGVRWWTSSEATYPKLKNAPIENIEYEYAPQFKYRETYYLDGFDPVFKVRSKGNFSSLTRYMFTSMKFIPPEWGGNHRLYFFKGRHSAYHSFFEVLPPKNYFKKHPEWFSLIKGKRKPMQLCLSNEAMKKEYVKQTLKRLKEDASVDFIQVSQNDEYGCCECAECKKMMDEDGGVASGPYLKFANYVAQEVEKEFPHVRIDTFAYQFTRKAPTKTRPRHNVVVRLCDIECDFARPLDTPSSKKNAPFVRDLEEWSKIAGGNLFIWDYLANFRNYIIPHPNINSIAPNIRLFAKMGVVGVFEQGDALCSIGSFAALRHYLTSHLLWDPNDDEKRLMREFLEGYYGKEAGRILEKFIAVIENGPRKTTQEVRCYHVSCPFLTGGDKLLAMRLMDEAEAAARKAGEPYATRVKKERLSVDHMLLLHYDAHRKAAAATKMKWIRPKTRKEAAKKWIEDVRSFGIKARHETVDPNEINRYFKSLVK